MTDPSHPSPSRSERDAAQAGVHEDYAAGHALPTEIGSDRSFGLIVGGIVGAIGLFPLMTSGALRWWLVLPGATLMMLGLLAPKLLHPLNVGWMKLGHLLGRIVTPIVLLLIYLIAVIPTGLLLRLFGKDVLGLKRKPDDGSYWIARLPPGPDPESLKQQF